MCWFFTPIFFLEIHESLELLKYLQTNDDDVWDVLQNHKGWGRDRSIKSGGDLITVEAS